MKHQNPVWHSASSMPYGPYGRNTVNIYDIIRYDFELEACRYLHYFTNYTTNIWTRTCSHKHYSLWHSNSLWQQITFTIAHGTHQMKTPMAIINKHDIAHEKQKIPMDWWGCSINNVSLCRNKFEYLNDFKASNTHTHTQTIKTITFFMAILFMH